jgi:hypothetical protein
MYFSVSPAFSLAATHRFTSSRSEMVSFGRCAFQNVKTAVSLHRERVGESLGFRLSRKPLRLALWRQVFRDDHSPVFTDFDRLDCSLFRHSTLFDYARSDARLFIPFGALIGISVLFARDACLQWFYAYSFGIEVARPAGLEPTTLCLEGSFVAA